jgi:hypothetical protein
VKLYQLIDDFAWADGGCQRRWRRFQAEGCPNLNRRVLFAPRYGKIVTVTHLGQVFWVK